MEHASSGNIGDNLLLYFLDDIFGYDAQTRRVLMAFFIFDEWAAPKSLQSNKVYIYKVTYLLFTSYLDDFYFSFLLV